MESPIHTSEINQPDPISRYKQLPRPRQHRTFWLLFFLAPPVAIAVLLSGDVYYLRNGEIRSFSEANAFVALVFCAVWIANLMMAALG